jgi:hypothetical protein
LLYEASVKRKELIRKAREVPAGEQAPLPLTEEIASEKREAN